MCLLAFDLGGTKLTTALIKKSGEFLTKKSVLLNGRQGREVGALIRDNFLELQKSNFESEIQSIGISIPGIYYSKTGHVWAPNIPGWEDYPLMDEIKHFNPTIPIAIDSDRACYILGEVWQGAAKNCNDAIFLAIGTGIGAGIITEGKVLRGAHNIAGAAGWMALKPPFLPHYKSCGCFEYHASGDGIARITQKFMQEAVNYSGELKNISPNAISAHHVFEAFNRNDELAVKVINLCIEFWGMASANLISLFNPEKLIFGGGVFGPAISLIPEIQKEAAKWCQPISFKDVSFEPSALNSDAGVYGAAYLALQNLNSKPAQNV